MRNLCYLKKKLQGEQIRSSFGSQGQSPSLLPGNQYQASSQQQLLGQAHTQVDIGSSHAYAAMDLQKFRGMQRSGFNVKDGPLTGNDGQLGSLMPPSSPMVKSDLEYLLKVSFLKRHHCRPLSIFMLLIFSVKLSLTVGTLI